MSHDGMAERRIANWFMATLNVEIPSMDTDLFETGVLDSLGFVELVVHLEQEFGINVALDQLEIDNFRSVERIAALVLEGAGNATAARSDARGAAG